MAQTRVSVLFLCDRRRSEIAKLLRAKGYFLVAALTTDQAVAMAVSNDFRLAILDQEMFIETDGWSVAQSLKLVKPGIGILLVSQAVRLNEQLPEGVDAMESDGNPQQVVKKAEELMQARS